MLHRMLRTINAKREDKTVGKLRSEERPMLHWVLRTINAQREDKSGG